MKAVFVDTSGFYAVLDATDSFHLTATDLFKRAEREQWRLLTTNRLGWNAVEDFLDVLLPLCRVEFVDERFHAQAAHRCRQAKLRHLSFTDCVSFECMKRHGITEAIASDEHFVREGIGLPATVLP